MSYTLLQIAGMNDRQSQRNHFDETLKKYTIEAQWMNLERYLETGGVVQPGTLLFARSTNRIFGVYLFHDETSIHFADVRLDWLGEVHQIQRYKIIIDLSHQTCLN